MKNRVTVFLPTGSRAEAEVAKRALSAGARFIVMGSVAGHTPGQRLSEDAVVVGNGVDLVRADVLGDVYQVDTMDDLWALGLEWAGRTGDLGGPAPTRAAEPAQASEAAKPALTAEELDLLNTPLIKLARATKDDPTPDESPDLDDLTRAQLMRYAAEHWPGARNWVRMSAPDLKDTIRELRG